MADWLEACTRWERIAFAQNARMNSDDAQRCFLENHRSQIDHLHKVIASQDAIIKRQRQEASDA